VHYVVPQIDLKIFDLSIKSELLPSFCLDKNRRLMEQFCDVKYILRRHCFSQHFA